MFIHNRANYVIRRHPASLTCGKLDAPPEDVLQESRQIRNRQHRLTVCCLARDIVDSCA
jgi:hypothetical protein